LFFADFFVPICPCNLPHRLVNSLLLFILQTPGKSTQKKGKGAAVDKGDGPLFR
jgi:hypothetical protein